MIRLASITSMLRAPINVHAAPLRRWSSAAAGDVDLCKSSFKIILGSSSMARRQILAEMGYDFSIMTADIDEKSIRKDKPEELVMALAQAKADAIIARLGAAGQLEEDAQVTSGGARTKTLGGLIHGCQKNCLGEVTFSGCSGGGRPPLNPPLQVTLLITADTVVVYKGVVREKPTNEEEARTFIKGYSGDHAAVVGSILVTNLTTGIKKGAWERAEIEEGITYNVAGGLMLEHPLRSPFVEAVVGDTNTVMGLSKALTEKLIAEVQQA